jgi:hypothetical protein
MNLICSLEDVVQPVELDLVFEARPARSNAEPEFMGGFV